MERWQFETAAGAAKAHTAKGAPAAVQVAHPVEDGTSARAAMR